MAKSKVIFSGKNIDLAEVATHYGDVSDALKLFFSASSPSFVIRFIGYSPNDIIVELKERENEIDLSTTMTLLAAVEAAFRIDYLQRCYKRKKDAVSRDFRKLYTQKDATASFEEDILEIWKKNTSGSSQLIGDLRGAFKFRHWMAHGRYWTPKLGRQFDYLSVYPIAQQAVTSFPLMTA